jgi:hypothetical protein
VHNAQGTGIKNRRVISSLVLCAVCLVPIAAAAQFGFGPRGYPPKFANEDSFGHGFNFCRAMYTSGRREAGGQGWSTDYPDAELNFSIRLGELTKMRVSKDSYGAPEHLVVRLTEDALFQCPYLHMEDVGTAGFTDEEIQGLRAFLLKGGFLWVDDYWGSYAWNNWVSQLARVLPPSEYPIRDVTLDHPIFRTMFDVKKLPQIPSIQFWRQSGGAISERGPDSDTPHIRGVSDKNGNLMVLMTHNTDISDAWEREGEDPRFFYNFSPDGYAVGINVILYAVTH